MKDQINNPTPTTDALKLDQTTVEKVVNGAPKFQEGVQVHKDKFIYMDGED